MKHCKSLVVVQRHLLVTEESFTQIYVLRDGNLVNVGRINVYHVKITLNKSRSHNKYFARSYNYIYDFSYQGMSVHSPEIINWCKEPKRLGQGSLVHDIYSNVKNQGGICQRPKMIFRLSVLRSKCGTNVLQNWYWAIHVKAQFLFRIKEQLWKPNNTLILKHYWECMGPHPSPQRKSAED